MAYNTGNPIGSIDARDLYDNAQNMDKAVNQTTARWTDRLGVSRPSWSGMSHYNNVGEYAADILITGYNEVFRYDGEFYRAAAATVLPYTTTGSWSEDGPLFVPVGDAVLRHDMAYEADTYIGYYRNAINCNQYGGLEAAVADADTLGKTIIVTDTQDVSIPLDFAGRDLAVDGGLITFSGTGTITGLKEARREWFESQSAFDACKLDSVYRLGNVTISDGSVLGLIDTISVGYYGSNLEVLTTGYALTAIGYDSLKNNTTGFNNTSIGKSALRENVGGINNTATGVDALEFNVSGGGNTATGVSSLVSNVSGSNNTALGFKSGYANVSGGGNTATGTTALQYNEIGNNNTAIGYEALTLCTGSHNTAVGMDAGINGTTGSYNTAVGKSALFSCGTGNYNTAVGAGTLQGVGNQSSNVAVGYESLSQNTANANVAVGRGAGGHVTTGGSNIFLGYLAGTDAVADITTASNKMVLGGDNITGAFTKVALTVTSDARDKTNIGAVPHGLDFISKLQPISYQFKTTREDDTPVGPVRYGFKAQDVLQLEGENSVVIDNSDTENLKYNSSSLIPILVNAIKELKAELDSMKLKATDIE